MNMYNPANPTTPIESRRTLRTMLLDARTALPDCITHDTALTHHLAEVLGALSIKRLTAYWPTQGEFDMPAVLGHRLAADATHHTLLPVVADKFSPLQFRRWAPDCEMTPGTYNIPIPRSGETETPDALLIPYVGSDAQCYRIGYDGGFYDHTLAALHAIGHRPCAIDVAYEVNRIESIALQSHDTAADCIVVGRDVF